MWQGGSRDILFGVTVIRRKQDEVAVCSFHLTHPYKSWAESSLLKTKLLPRKASSIFLNTPH